MKTLWLYWVYQFTSEFVALRYLRQVYWEEKERNHAHTHSYYNEIEICFVFLWCTLVVLVFITYHTLLFRNKPRLDSDINWDLKYIFGIHLYNEWQKWFMSIYTENETKIKRKCSFTFTSAKHNEIWTQFNCWRLLIFNYFGLNW